MATPLPFIHIKAAKFPVLPGEEEELVNPGTYGKSLAQHVEARLGEHGYEVAFSCCEDWGWWVEIKGLPFVTGVRVYSTSDLPATHELCVTVTPAPGRRWSWRRFRAMDTTPFVTKLFADLTEIFTADPDVEILGFPEEYPFSEPLSEEDLE